jgi:hypothetical protein
VEAHHTSAGPVISERMMMSESWLNSSLTRSTTKHLGHGGLVARTTKREIRYNNFCRHKIESLHAKDNGILAHLQY